MLSAYPLAEVKAAIEDTAKQFFSGGSLANKRRSALALSEMTGLNLFITELPWRINLPKGKSITGLSENLRFAAQDIHACLVALEKVLPPTARLKITINEQELASLQKTKQTIKGN